MELTLKCDQITKGEERKSVRFSQLHVQGEVGGVRGTLVLAGLKPEEAEQFKEGQEYKVTISL